jgi:hypothetical protein
MLFEFAPWSPLETWVSPSRPLGPITRCRARQAMYRLVQDDDGGGSDTGSESRGREFHPDQMSLSRDEDYCPSPTEAEPVGLGDHESDGEDECLRKRRKFSRSSASLLCHLAASVERPCRGRPSLRSASTRSTHKGKNARASSILSAASGQATSDETEARAVLARFKEWPLKNVVLKHITEDSITTFQLQFDWNPCIKLGHASSAI